MVENVVYKDIHRTVQPMAFVPFFVDECERRITDMGRRHVCYTNCKYESDGNGTDTGARRYSVYSRSFV